MSVPDEDSARARTELAAARLLSDNDFGAQAVSRAYYASFYAAEAALLELGETRAKHSGVVSAVGQLLVRGQGVDERAGRLLRFPLRASQPSRLRHGRGPRRGSEASR